MNFIDNLSNILQKREKTDKLNQTTNNYDKFTT